MNGGPILLALLSAALFGVATPASKWLLVGLTPFQLAGLLYLGAALVVAPTALRQGGLALPRRTDQRNRLRLLGAVFFGGICGPLALLFGLRLAQATSVSLWLNLELAATATLGALVFRDHLGFRGWLGVLATLSASALLTWGPAAAGLVPGLLILIACLCWGLDNHLTALIDGITPSQSTLWKGTVAGTVNLTIGGILAPISVDLQILLAALMVGALSYGVSIVLYIRSAQAIGATRAQVLFASAPFFGVGLAVLGLGESFALVHGLAVPLFAGGVAFLLIDGHGHDHTHEAMSHKHSHRHDDEHHTHVHTDLPPAARHTHFHQHEPTSHRHPHWPDLHHRHKHDSAPVSDEG
jgi:drug/metabolite transporter (DMT)-like permease